MREESCSGTRGIKSKEGVHGNSILSSIGFGFARVVCDGGNLHLHVKPRVRHIYRRWAHLHARRPARSLLLLRSHDQLTAPIYDFSAPAGMRQGVTRRHLDEEDAGKAIRPSIARIMRMSLETKTHTNLQFKTAIEKQRFLLSPKL